MIYIRLPPYLPYGFTECLPLTTNERTEPLPNVFQISWPLSAVCESQAPSRVVIWP